MNYTCEGKNKKMKLNHFLPIKQIKSPPKNNSWITEKTTTKHTVSPMVPLFGLDSQPNILSWGWSLAEWRWRSTFVSCWACSPYYRTNALNIGWMFGIVCLMNHRNWKLKCSNDHISTIVLGQKNNQNISKPYSHKCVWGSNVIIFASK